MLKLEPKIDKKNDSPGGESNARSQDVLLPLQSCALNQLGYREVLYGHLNPENVYEMLNTDGPRYRNFN